MGFQIQEQPARRRHVKKLGQHGNNENQRQPNRHLRRACAAQKIVEFIDKWHSGEWHDKKRKVFKVF